jgi:hypothetical protein
MLLLQNMDFRQQGNQTHTKQPVHESLQPHRPTCCRNDEKSYGRTVGPNHPRHLKTHPSDARWNARYGRYISQPISERQLLNSAELNIVRTNHFATPSGKVCNKTLHMAAGKFGYDGGMGEKQDATDDDIDQINAATNAANASTFQQLTQSNNALAIGTAAASPSAQRQECVASTTDDQCTGHAAVPVSWPHKCSSSRMFNKAAATPVEALEAEETALGRQMQWI